MRSGGGSIASSPAARGDPGPERREINGEQVAQALDPGLDEELVLGGPKPARLSIRASSRQVATSLIVAPTWSASDWRRVGRLGDLQQDPRREDPLLLESVEIDGLDAGELGDGRHGRVGLRWAGGTGRHYRGPVADARNRLREPASTAPVLPDPAKGSGRQSGQLHGRSRPSGGRAASAPGPGARAPRPSAPRGARSAAAPPRRTPPGRGTGAGRSHRRCAPGWPPSRGR